MARRGLAISLIYIFHTVSFTQSLIPSSRSWVGDIGKSRDTTTPTTTSSNHHLYQRRHQSSRTKLSAFFLNDKDDNNKTPSKNNATPLGKDGSSANADLLQTLELKDEALYQAQTAVSSLEKALESAVTNLENMQQQLQLRVLRLEKELRTTKGELTDTMGELQKTRTELQSTREELTQSREERDGLDWALGQSQEGQQKAETRVEELETYLATLGVDAETITAKKKVESNPWQLWPGNSKTSVPVLNDWVVINGSIEGEVQISGKVTNHPSIPDGDAIVTSPLSDATQAAEKKIVSTSSGSKYKLGKPMDMPANQSPSKYVGGGKGSNSQQYSGSRASIALPDLTGKTIGNGRYLLAGPATPSVNGRSFIQTAYRSSPVGKPIGEPLAIKVSQNKEAMKREFANYQKVSAGLKKGHFIRRNEFLPVAGNEMPDKSALVMQRGVADVKAFMPKVGGRLEGEMLMDCAVTALRCVEALHAVKLVWNDLKTENFVVIEDGGGVSFRGIDLESCMTVRTNPVDYTPEACPPEFAQSFLDGDAESFLLEYSYDVWSYGMFLYEISTGRGFFDGYSAEKITKLLPSFEPDVSQVPDAQLADLILQCLSKNPKDRPSLVRIAKHPYLASATASKTPFDFLFGSSI
eukprot:g6450.t1 g6450   contig23:489575-491568(-)